MNLKNEMEVYSGAGLDTSMPLIEIDDAVEIAKQYAEEKCKEQREICANKAHPVLNHELFRDMQNEIRNASLATED